MIGRKFNILRVAAIIGVGFFYTLANADSGNTPQLPTTNFDYVGYAVEDLPRHFGNGTFGTLTSHDNTPADNQITNAGATLGRVLFYDKRLSHGNSQSCASCHRQENGFSDPRPKSVGANGVETPRHSMGLTNASFYSNGRFLSDELAESLEQQVLMPIVNPDELGSSLEEVTTKLNRTEYYPQLFEEAFGTSEINADRVSKAMAQFVRSMTSYNSKFDRAFDESGNPDFENGLTEQERLGHEIFNGIGRCSFCHVSHGQVAGDIHNNGLDLTSEDSGAGNGKFKSASLRNAGVRGAFMHDGRFSTLEEVVDFYSSQIKDNPDLDFRLRDDSNDNRPFKPNFTDAQKRQLVAFLNTLTDYEFLENELFADPFGAACDLNGDMNCDVDDLNALLAHGRTVDGIDVTPENEPFDLNGDGVIDNADRTRWLAEAAEHNGLSGPYIEADANLDGRVDVSDFNIWNANKFSETIRWDQGDFNGDGVVDVSDFNTWNANKFTEVLPTNVVPEPSTWWLLCVALVGITRLCRSR